MKWVNYLLENLRWSVLPWPNRHCVFSTGRAHWWVTHWIGGAEAATSATLEKLTGGQRPLATEIDSKRVQGCLSKIFWSRLPLVFLLLLFAYRLPHFLTFCLVSLGYTIPTLVPHFRRNLFPLSGRNQTDTVCLRLNSRCKSH